MLLVESWSHDALWTTQASHVQDTLVNMISLAKIFYNRSPTLASYREWWGHD